ncbi:VCBS domain-containing protein [Pseudomonadota bacterium DY0742]|uniref:VCBS domain-containing protein n=1 Tax=Stutzerimonas balearica TaxID=74829 RepID=UPI001BCA2FC2|nr:VCBS domain-containing protein [Stutzerimonas balearica]MBS4149918.1 tandem-95 repeat protein [Stutzerimonas balearica]
MADQSNTPSAHSRLLRARPRPLALEQRFVFDGAAAADAVDVAEAAASQAPAAEPAGDAAAAIEVALVVAAPERQVESAPAPAQPAELFHTGSDDAQLNEAAQQAAEQIRQFLAESSDAQLFELFNGEQASPEEAWSAELAKLRASIADGTLTLGVQLLDNATIQGALAAYAPQSAGSEAVIYLNRDWLEVLDASQVARLLTEEYGHHLDYLLNQGGDTAGDEGQRFTTRVNGGATDGLGFAADDDHGTLQLDDHSQAVEFATLTFSNAYEVNRTTTPAGKEANSHDFVFSSLGQVSVTDATNSRFFSGNDVSATALTIGNDTYYGWISRPIKSNGVVRGFYFWTDSDFDSLAAAQADGNQDGDSNVADNRGFLLVVDQAWFGSLGWKDQALNLKNVGSSSDRVDAALNTLVGAPVAPVANADVASGQPGSSGGAALEAGGTANGTAGSAATGNVLSNDTSADSKTVSAVGTSAASQAVGAATTSANGTVVTGLYGTLTLGADGSYRYVVDDANPQVEALRSVSDTLVDTFTYRMTDASGATATTTLKVTIQGANDAPVAANDYNVAKESIAPSGQYTSADASGSLATGNVLANDTDVDRNGETKTVVGIRVDGAATGNTGGTTTFNTTLDSNDANSISTGATVWRLNSDGTRTQLMSGSTAVTVTGKTGSGSTVGFTFSDSSALSGITRFSVMKNNGTYVDGTINSTTVTSSTTLSLAGVTGNIAVGMTVSGTGLATAPTVSSVNYDASGHVTSVVLSSAVGLTNQALTFSASKNPGITLTGQYGSLLLNADGSYTYTPTANNPALSIGQSGIEQFQYTMRDTSGATSSATLFITVYGSGSNDPNAVNDAVEATEAGGTANGTLGVNPGTPANQNLLANDTTPIGSNTIVSARATDSSTGTAIGSNTVLVGRYGTLTLSSNGSYSYVVDNSNPTVQALRDANATLSETFLYTVENGQTANGVHLQDTATLTVTIRGANDAPVAGDTSASALEAGGVNNGTAGYNPSGNVLNAVTDVDDARSELRVTAVRTGSVEGSGSAGAVGSALAGQYGSLTLNADGSWTYTVDNNNASVQALNPGETLTEQFNYSVTDRSGTGLTDTAVLTITLDGVADTVAVNSVFVNEASPYAVFTVSGSAGVAVNLSLSDSVGLPASDARATLGSDLGSALEYYDGSAWVGYTPGSQVVIPSGDKLLVRVAINQDNVHEGNESFTLTATTASGSSLGFGTINDEGEGDRYTGSNTSGTPDSGGSLDDDRPTLSVSSPSTVEGGYAEFLVSLDKLSSNPVIFSPSVVSGSASVGIDTSNSLERFDGNAWVTVSGPVGIAAGELSVRLRVATLDDSAVEPAEAFTLLTGPVSGGTVTNLVGTEGTATIIDNDFAAPTNGAPVAVNDSFTASEDTPATYTAAQLLGNDSDPDHDPLAIASVTRGTGGDVVLNQDGSVTFTPDANFNGTATFTYTATDGSLDSNSATVTIAVAAVNDPAVIGGTDTGSVTEDLNVNGQGNLTTSGTLAVADPDAGEAGFTGTVTPSNGTLGSLTTSTNGTWTYSVPNTLVQYLKAGETRTETFTVQSIDGTPHTVTVTVNGVSDVAQIGGTDTGSVTEDLNINGQGNLTTSGNLTVTDPDSGEAGFTGTVTPANGTLGTLTIAPNGTWTYSVPNTLVQYLKAGETRTETFTVQSIDGTPHTVTVTVNGVSDVAQISGTDTGSVTEDLNVNGQGNLTTGGSLSVNDPDAGEAGFTGIVTPANGALGSLTIEANGTWTYSVPNTLVQYLKAGETRTETFTVQSIDGTPHTVTVTVNGVSDTAQFGGTDTGSVTEDLNVNGQGNLTTSGTLTVTDPDAGEAGFTGIVTPANGTLGSLTIEANGTWTYSVPNTLVQYLKAGETRTETFTVQSIDGTPHTVTVTVNGVSDTAQFGGTDTGSVTEDLNVNGQGNLTTSGTLTVTDPDAGEAGFTGIVTPANGTLGSLTIEANGTWTYSVPNTLVQHLKAGETRTETFTVQSIDGTPHTVTVTVNGVSDVAQIGGTDSGAVTEDLGVNGQGKLTTGGTLTVADPDAGEAGFTGIVTPVNGTLGNLTIEANGSWTYSVPNALVQYLKTGETKTETFTVRSIDGTPHTVTVTIHGANDAAVIGGTDTGAVTEDLNVVAGKLSVGGALTVASPDAGSSLFQGTVTPSAEALGTLTIAPNGNWIYSVPNALVQYLKAGETKLETFTVSTADGTTHSVSVTIHGVNDAAVFAAEGRRGSVQEDTRLVAQDRLLVSDADHGEAAVVAQTLKGAYGEFSIDAGGRWRYVLDNAAPTVQSLDTTDSRLDTFVVAGVDGSRVTVTVEVQGLNEPALPPVPAAPVPAPAPVAVQPPAAPEPLAPPPPPAPFDATVVPANSVAAPSPTAAPLLAAAQAREPIPAFGGMGSFGDLYTQRSGFQVVVLEAQQARLSLYHGIGDQYADSGTRTSFSVPYDAFAHTDPNERVLLSASQANGQPLPGWVRFDAQSGKFELSAPGGYRGELSIKVVARDSQGREASALFRFNVGDRRAPELGGRTGLSEQLRQAGQRSAPTLEQSPPARGDAGAGRPLGKAG